ncbi:MAG: hypothetical protein IT423_07935 [Pirellulaceae bacterium]|nr:hypothetical protein [Pirellulaceae bacterium]
MADHFEADWGAAPFSQQQTRVSRWMNDYRPSVAGIADSRGRPPQHTFFCPIEVYDPRLMEQIAALTRSGFGDVEIHLHHDNDNPEHLTQRLVAAVQALHQRHGLLSKDASGTLRYGFIHGNWALDNSDPKGRWCGVNNEITVLRQTGCYADFTMPAAPHAAQTRTINSIYYAVDDPAKPKSHDTGIAAAVHALPPEDSLLMIQGPLVVTSPLLGKISIENGNIAGSQPPSEQRLANWIRAQVIVKGQPNWIFIKVHTHGAQEKNSEVLLGESMRGFHECLRRESLRREFEYFYVTAKETAQLVHQAEQGLQTPNFELLGWH